MCDIINFKEASDSFINVFDKQQQQCKPIEVKLIPKGKNSKRYKNKILANARIFLTEALKRAED